MPSPVGRLSLVAADDRLVQIAMEGQISGSIAPTMPNPVLEETRRQLEAYFEGRLRTFDLPLGAIGTPFRERVWRALMRVPFGETCAYMDVANALGAPKAVRAIGGAIGKNPIGIVVPCHRIVGRDGSMTGYAGGVERKVWLLDHEARHLGAHGPA